MSFAAAGGFGSFGRLNYGGSRSGLSSWAAPQVEEESFGSVGRTGGALVAVNGAGTWRRLNWPELGKTAFPQRLLAVGVPWGWHEVVCMLE